MVINSQRARRLGSALFYGFSSLLITIVNKTVLTSYNFPSFQVLAIGQMLATIIVLSVAKKLRLVDFPPLETSTLSKIWPLPVIYAGNMIFGLGGTKRLSLPMFTALRRFGILMTMLGEFYVLGSKPRPLVQLAVFVMILGATVAASDDLAFDPRGYVFILASDAFTAANGVYVKQKLESKELGKYGLMFYNSLFATVPALLLAWYQGDAERAAAFSDWTSLLFVGQFLLSCVMGVVLSYSIILCTLYNSALTTSIVGCLKNLGMTYLGMAVGGDYVFSWLNFVGLNFSVLGSLLYTWVTFGKKDDAAEAVKYSPLRDAAPDKGQVV